MVKWAYPDGTPVSDQEPLCTFETREEFLYACALGEQNLIRRGNPHMLQLLQEGLSHPPDWPAVIIPPGLLRNADKDLPLLNSINRPPAMPKTQQVKVGNQIFTLNVPPTPQQITGWPSWQNPVVNSETPYVPPTLDHVFAEEENARRMGVDYDGDPRAENFERMGIPYDEAPYNDLDAKFGNSNDIAAVPSELIVNEYGETAYVPPNLNQVLANEGRRQRSGVRHYAGAGGGGPRGGTHVEEPYVAPTL